MKTSVFHTRCCQLAMRGLATAGVGLLLVSAVLLTACGRSPYICPLSAQAGACASQWQAYQATKTHRADSDSIFSGTLIHQPTMDHRATHPLRRKVGYRPAPSLKPQAARRVAVPRRAKRPSASAANARDAALFLLQPAGWGD